MELYCSVAPTIDMVGGHIHADQVHLSVGCLHDNNKHPQQACQHGIRLWHLPLVFPS
jgi:hypothetical protein